VRKRAAAALLAATLAGCSASQSADNAAVCDAYHAGRSRIEVVAAGTVTRVLGTQAGRVSPHEGFLMRLASGCDLVVRVEANTDFTGTFALARGDVVSVKGEYEYYTLGGVIHWTHRDPRGRHDGGYIQTKTGTYN
jgi:Protein of unknown function (DUF3465)